VESECCARIHGALVKISGKLFNIGENFRENEATTTFSLDHAAQQRHTLFTAATRERERFAVPQNPIRNFSLPLQEENVASWLAEEGASERVRRKEEGKFAEKINKSLAAHSHTKVHYQAP
jgi:hypothetical protein